MELSEEEKEAIKNVRRFANILMKNKQVTIGIDNASNELIASLYKVLELLEGKNAVIETYKHTEKVLTEQIDEQQKEIEEKTTILLAGAEKVKQLEKGNRSLMESRIKWKNRYYKEKAKNKECISKDKIREILEDLDEFDDYFFNVSTLKEAIKNSLKQLLEEK